MKIIKLVFLALLIATVFAGVFPLCATILAANDASADDILYGSVTLHIAFVTAFMLGLALVACLGLIRRLAPRQREVREPDATRPQRFFDPTLAIVVFALVAVFNIGTLNSALAGFSATWVELIGGTTKMMDAAFVNSLVADVKKIQPEDSDQVVSLSGAYLHASGRLLDVYGRFMNGLLQTALTSNAIAFYCWWLLLFLMGTLLTSATNLRSNILNHTGSWVASLKNPEKQRLLLGLVFVVGLYFSVAAIIAIPALQHTDLDTPINRDYVEKALNSVSTSKDSFQSRFPEAYKKELPLLAAARKALDEIPAEIRKRAAENPIPGEAAAYIAFYDKRRGYLDEILKEWVNTREQLMGVWSKHRGAVLSRQENLAKRAVNAFEVGTLNPLSGPERVAYLQQVVYWFQIQQGYGERALQDTMQQIDNFDINLSYSMPDIPSAVFAVSPYRAGMQQDGPMLKEDPITALFSRSYYPTSTYAMDHGESAMPNPPEPGAFAGAFGFIAQWLLSTRSFPLALITGMIGFGLLGAAVTNYVRTDIPNGQTVAAERVIIQGVSAAIVVFLSVQGGLAMLASGDKEPNGYVMCFACFVGAVFSEHVWVWARVRLMQMLPDKSPTNPPTSPPVATPPA